VRVSLCYIIHLCTYIRDLYSASVSGVSQVHRRMDFRFPRVKSLVYSIIIIIIMMIIIIIRISLAAAYAAKGLMVDKINLIAFKTQKCSIPFAHVSKLNSIIYIVYTADVLFHSLSFPLYLSSTKTASALKPKKFTYTYVLFINYFPPNLFIFL